MPASARIVCTLMVVVMAAHLAAEDPIAVAESFLLAGDRERMVAALPSGSGDQRYYRCLLWQQEGKLAQVDELLAAWKERAKEEDDLVRFARIRARQALLWYQTDHQRSLDLLARELDPGVAEPSQAYVAGAILPASLDPALLSWEAVRARGIGTGDLVRGFTEEGLARIAAGFTDSRQASAQLGHLQLRALLERLSRPAFPHLVELVIAELGDPASPGFGAIAIHRRLDRAQLEACRAELPALGGNAEFIRAFIMAIRQAHGEDSRDRDPAALRSYLDDLLAFSTALTPGYSRLEALVRCNQLDLARATGTVSRDDLIAYLRLPGTAAAIAGRRSPTAPAVAGEDWEEVTGLHGSDGEREVIEDCLALVLAKEEDESAFAPAFTPIALREMLVDAKLAAGIGDDAQWLQLLRHPRDAERCRQPELRFTPGADSRFHGGDEAFLEVQLRNVQSAQLRVFSLNAAAIYRRTEAEIQPTIDLNGVVPNQERALAFPGRPLRRQRERIVLPECAAPGLYVVEIVAAGRSIRALIRKGQLREVACCARDGQRLRVYDEDGHRVLQASAWLNGQEFAADAAGEIRIPYAKEALAKNLVLVQGGRASLARHQLATESHALGASLLLDPEQLIAGTVATALLRLHLSINDEALPLAALRDATLEVTTLTADDVPQTTVIPLDHARDGEEAVIRFPVPERTGSVSWQVHGLVALRSRAGEERLDAAGRIACNGIDRTMAIANTFLEHGAEGYDLAHLGRNGEAVTGAVLHLELTHRLLERPILLDLATDATGRAHLGTLPGIDALRLAGAEEGARGSPRRWLLHALDDGRGRPPIHIIANGIVRVPWYGESMEDTSLARGGAPWPTGGGARHLDLEGGMLTLSGLPAGTYELAGSSHQQLLVVADGIADGDLVVGGDQATEIGNAGLLGVTARLEVDGSATITVSGAGAHPRVHVLGRRFHAFADLAFGERPGALRSWSLPLLRSSFTAALDLGDEYRYVAARAGAKRLPGVMLERPGLLLNAWQDDKLNGDSAVGLGGGAGGMRNGGGKRRSLAQGGGATAREAIPDSFDNVDFLAAPGIVLANLIPDGQGQLHLAPAQFGDARLLAIIACDDHMSAHAAIALPPRGLVRRDLALARALDPASHPAFKYRSLVVPAGGSLAIPAGAIAQRVYRDLGDAFRLFTALAPEAKLEEFSFLPRWRALSGGERLSYYGRFASHELNLFLYCKDRPFFDRVVAPYLVNKLQKGFLDHWLLGDDLTPWLEGARHDELNACERILLAHRLGGTAAGDEIRSLGGSGEPTAADLAAWNAWARIALAAQVQRAEQPKMDAVPPAPQSDPERAIRNGVPLGPEFYRSEDATAALSERSYFGVSDSDPDARAGLVEMNRFWYEYARHGGGAILTPACLAAHANRSEILLALAVIDLPFPADGADGAPSAPSAALVFRSGIESLPLRPGDLMLEQRLYRGLAAKDDLNGAALVGGDLLPGTAYCSVITVINPSPHDRQVDLLGQIPQGAVAISGSPAVLGRSLLIEAFSSVHLDLAFYFPAAGTFAQCPAHLAEGEAVVAVATATRELRVHAERAPADPWHQLSPDDLIAYLDSADLSTVDFTPLVPRLLDKGLFAKVVDALQRRRIFDRRLWFCSLRLDLPAAITSLLLREEGFVARIGMAIDSPLLRLDPIADRLVQHLDFAPLINARIHSFAGMARGGSRGIAARYGETLAWLCLRADPGSLGWLELAYQLMLQDRIEEAQAAFARIDAKGITASIQYDYLHAWLALHQADAASARAVAARYAGHPIEAWRLRFAEIAAQLDEIEGRPATREAALARQQRQQLQAAGEPSLHAELSDGRIAIVSTHVPECEVRYYPMDLELLFSRAPFAIGTGDRIIQVNPALVERIVLDPLNPAQQFALAPAYRQRTAIVEIAGAGLSQILVSYAHALDLRLAQASGQLMVAHAGDGKPIPAAYVKVYAELESGAVQFLKDGYTDLRGRFDYITVNGGDPAAIRRLALLVDADAFGSTVREVRPPTR